ncbi:unnamed protein product [Rotaria sp. Silwood2]|nr:unnamed protein product [Rotaria sp. Silwood2]CAF3198477.1 unnamed protein product [Rotaria sp. Silwood2]CAF3328300.1 unnamed protein product [Rotaria sp. Silwood2]CAF4201515.1 unnamed protein product [Rotaria sp. Silwood2]CAF4254557.1 unnamed protein product [Rotaria sp. Silwood2]
MASMEQELLPFLENISSYSDDIFYKFVREFVGVIESEILEIRRIKNVRILLQVPDVFLFFQINSKDILKLKEKACFVTDDLQFIVRPGIKSNIEQFIEALKKYYESTSTNVNYISSQRTSNSEDSTGVISSVSYDSRNDCFIGFSPRLVNGLPFVDQFKTNSYTELQQWFEDFDKSTLVNAHLVEPLLSNSSSLVHSRPCILSAYGTNNKYTAIDVLRKWMYLYNECKKRNINVVGFSTDCDPCYLKAMQLSLGFFTKAPNIDLLTGNNNLLETNIASH